MISELRPIRASIDESFLSKVDRVFDATPRTVFNELIQNARRAGATRIILELLEVESGTHLVFKDNGRGCNSPEALLRLSNRDGWDKQVVNDEDPAGMGFFSLSNFDTVEVATKQGWKADISNAAFRGEEDVRPIPITDLDGSDIGMMIAWTWKGEAPYRLDDAFHSAACYCGVEEVLVHRLDENHEIERREVVPVKDYLEKADYVVDHSDKGYRIGIFSRSISTDSLNFGINFKGVAIRVERGDHPFDYYDSQDLGLGIRVDVDKATDIKLVLPARNAIKENDALKQLQKDVELAFMTYVAENRKGDHRLSYKAYKACLDMGIDIGEAKPDLSYYGNYFTKTEECLNTTVLVPPAFNDEPCLDILNDIGLVHYARVKPRMEGYDWYNNIPEIKSGIVTINEKHQVNARALAYDGDHDDALEDAGVPDDDEMVSTVDSIHVGFTLSNGKMLVAEPSIVFFSDERQCCFDELSYNTRIFATKPPEGKEAADHAYYMATATEQVMFKESEDSESDSVDTQRHEFSEAAILYFLGLFVTPEESLRHGINTALAYNSHIRPKDTAWRAEYQPDADPRIQVTRLYPVETGEERVITMIPSGNDIPAQTIVVHSRAPINEDRVRKLLLTKFGYDCVADDKGTVIISQPLGREEFLNLDEIDDNATT